MYMHILYMYMYTICIYSILYVCILYACICICVCIYVMLCIYKYRYIFKYNLKTSCVSCDTVTQVVLRPVYTGGFYGDFSLSDACDWVVESHKYWFI